MIWNRLRSYFAGDVPRGMLLCAQIPLILICYFGTITFTAFALRESYDWRSSAISYLLSPRHDPGYHWITSLGLSLSGFLGIPFGGYIRDRLRPVSRLGANIGMTVLMTGFVALILAATIVTRHTHHVIGKFGFHEILARVSALALGAGIVCFCWCVLRELFNDGTDRTLFAGRLAAMWTTLILLPSIAALICGVCAFIPRVGIPRLLPVYELLRHSPLWKLAFWEWTGSIVVFLFLLSAAVFLPKHVTR